MTILGCGIRSWPADYFLNRTIVDIGKVFLRGIIYQVLTRQ